MTTKRTTSNDSHLCLFSFSDGRQCRMLRHKDHATLCIFHARAERQLIEADKLGREIAASPSGEYLTAVDVNHVLGKLFGAVAQNRLPTRNAAILAYLGQLLLQSVPKVQDENHQRGGYRLLARPRPRYPRRFYSPQGRFRLCLECRSSAPPLTPMPHSSILFSSTGRRSRPVRAVSRTSPPSVRPSLSVCLAPSSSHLCAFCVRRLPRPGLGVGACPELLGALDSS